MSTEQTAENDYTLGDHLLDHEFRTCSTSRNGFNTNHAGCICGAEYEWYDREAHHKQHIYDVTVAWADARATVSRADLSRWLAVYDHSWECSSHDETVIESACDCWQAEARAALSSPPGEQALR